MNLKEFQDFDGYEDKLIDANKTCYAFLPFATNKEKDFIDSLESNKKILFYFRIPAWFEIQNPYGKYNPGWAILVKEGGQSKVQVFDLIMQKQNDSTIESKQYCAKRHFDALGMNYARIGSVEEMKQQLA